MGRGRCGGSSTWCCRRSAGWRRSNILLTTILTFNYFDIIYVLTRGGPLNATAIFPTRIYEVGFGQFRFGEAAAYGASSVVVLVLLVAILWLLLRGRAGERHA